MVDRFLGGTKESRSQIIRLLKSVIITLGLFLRDDRKRIVYESVKLKYSGVLCKICDTIRGGD